jgi:hydrogenase maturation protein HypF
VRARKARGGKPFAVMVRDLAAARALAEIDDAEAAVLTSPARPVVLLRRRPGAAVADGVAPDNPWLIWALHRAHITAENRGWRPVVLRRS